MTDKKMNILSKLACAAAIAAMTSIGSGTAHAGQNSICSVAPEDAFFSNFKCARLMEMAWSQDFQNVGSYSKAEMLYYINGLVQAMHGQMAPFLLAPELLQARDPRLPFQLSMKGIADQKVLGDTMTETMDILGDLLGVFVDERRRQVNAGTIDPLAELGALGRGMSSINGSKIIWAAKLGEHDFQTLAALSQSDPDTAVTLYQGLVVLAGRL